MSLHQIQEIFNNREIAFLLWLSVAILYFASLKRLRPAILSLIKAFFQPRLLYLQLLAWIYITIIILLMAKISLWNIEMMKDTLIWVLISSFYLLIKAFDSKEDKYFATLLLDLLKIITIFEVIVNLYTFSLIVEIILVPILAIILMMQVFSANKLEYRSAHKFLNSLLVLFGIWVLVYSIYQISIHFKELKFNQIGLNYFFTIWITISFVPFIYGTVLFDAYHQLFIQINSKIGRRDRILAKYLKQKIIIKYSFNLRKIKRLKKEINKSYFTSKTEIDDFLNNRST